MPGSRSRSVQNMWCYWQVAALLVNATVDKEIQTFGRAIYENDDLQW